jgi:hypothetical protein
VTRTIPVYLEIGDKRTFAGAIEWPGWCRSGRDEEAALDALVAYAPRYARVVAGRPYPFTAPHEVAALDVSERLRGDATTDFGAPGAVPAADERPASEKELGRQVSLLEACWDAFDGAVAAADGKPLRKGPRGGGRDVAKIVSHVAGADGGYLTKLGSKVPRAVGDAAGEEVAALRARIREAVMARFRGEPLAERNRVSKLWTPRYFVRRAAWHVLDHAWEIEDRIEAG